MKPRVHMLEMGRQTSRQANKQNRARRERSDLRGNEERWTRKMMRKRRMRSKRKWKRKCSRRGGDWRV